MMNKSKLVLAVKDIEKKEEKRYINIEAEEKYINDVIDFLGGQSVEAKRYDLLKSLYDEIKESSLQQLLDLNNKILIPFLKELPKNLEKLNLKTYNIDKLQIKEEKKIDKILSGLGKVLSNKLQDNIELKQYMNQGKEGLTEIESRISQLKEVDKEELKKIGIIKNELSDYTETLKKENKVLKSLLSHVKPSFISKIFKTEYSPNKGLTKLKSLISKEIAEHNRVLSELGEIKLTDNKEKTKEILLLEKEELQLDKDLLLLLNQFDIPKMKFPSRKYIAFSCSWQEALKRLEHDELFISLPVFSTGVFVGNRTVKTDYFHFFINSVTSFSQGEIFFICPLEHVLKNSLFILNKSTIRVFEQISIGIKDLNDCMKTLDKLEKELEEKYKVFMDQSKKLDEDFDEKWSTDAEKLIEEKFVDKWMQEFSDEFMIKNDFDIVSLLLGMETYDKKISKEEAKEKLLKLSRKDFKQIVKNAKSFYKEIISDVKKIKSIKYPSLKDTLVLVPEQYLLYFEKQFEKNRPNIYYYDGEPDIEKIVDECNKETKIKKLPKIKKIRLFVKETMTPLETY